MGTRAGSAGGRRRAGAARRACLGPATRSCVQYVCLGGRPRASVRRGPRGPAQLRDCRSRSAPARLVPAGSCARPSDVNGGNGGRRRGFGLSQAESAAGRGREGRGAARQEGAAPGEGAAAGEPRQAPARPRPECEGGRGPWGRGVTSRPAAPPPVPRRVLSCKALRRDRIQEPAKAPPDHRLPTLAALVGNVSTPKHVDADGRTDRRPRWGQVLTRGTGPRLSWAIAGWGLDRLISDIPSAAQTAPLAGQIGPSDRSVSWN